TTLHASPRRIVSHIVMSLSLIGLVATLLLWISSPFVYFGISRVGSTTVEIGTLESKMLFAVSWNEIGAPAEARWWAGWSDPRTNVTWTPLGVTQRLQALGVDFMVSK